MKMLDLREKVSGKFVLIMGIVFAGLLYFMRAWFGPYFRENTGGYQYLELSLFYSPQDLYSLLHSYGPIGRALYTKSSLLFDFLYPLQYSLFFSSFCLWLSKRLTLAKGFYIAFTWGGILLCLSDWLENVFLLLTIQFYPQQINVLAVMACGFTILKTVLTVLFCAGICIGSIMLVFRLCRKGKLIKLSRMTLARILIAVMLTGSGLYLANLLIKFYHKQQLIVTTAQLPDLQQVGDGSYHGYYDGQLVSAKITVIVENHRMLDILLTEHVSKRGESAESIIPNILSAQSLDVDAISGATQSSTVIKKAIENALNSDLTQ